MSLLTEIINKLGTNNSAYSLIFTIDKQLVGIRDKLCPNRLDINEKTEYTEIIKEIDSIREKLDPTFRMVEC